jgi:hypothetical protein
MNNHDQIAAFANELDKLCDRYASEFDLSSAAACGVLMMKVRLIQDTAIRESNTDSE